MIKKLIKEVAGVNPEIINISRDILEQIVVHISNINQLERKISIKTKITFKGKSFYVLISLVLTPSNSYDSNISGAYSNNLNTISIYIDLLKSEYTPSGLAAYIKDNLVNIFSVISHEIKHFLDCNHFLSDSTNQMRSVKYASPENNIYSGSESLTDFYYNLYITNDIELRATYEEIYSWLIKHSIVKSEFLKHISYHYSYSKIYSIIYNYSYSKLFNGIMNEFTYFKYHNKIFLDENNFETENEAKFMLSHFILREIRHSLIRNELFAVYINDIKNYNKSLNSRFFDVNGDDYRPVTEKDINLNNIFFAKKIDIMTKNSGKFLKKIAKLYSLLPNG